MKDFIVRVVILMAIMIAIMVWVGWIRFDRTPDRATIEVQTSEIERAAGKAIEAGKELARDAEESIHDATAPDHEESSSTTTSTERSPEHVAPIERP